MEETDRDPYQNDDHFQNQDQDHEEENIVNHVGDEDERESVNEKIIFRN